MVKRYIRLDISSQCASGLASDILIRIYRTIAGQSTPVTDLDRIAGWMRVFGMVNSAPGFDRYPAVINGFSDLILAVFGPEVGRHARSAIGVAGLPFNIAVEVEAEVTLRA